MSNKTEKSSIHDFMMGVMMLIITGISFFCTYYFNFTTPVLAILWIVWLVALFLLAFFTKKGKQAFEFAKEAKIEMEKVVWPNRQETVQTTSIVMIMVTIASIILWIVDSGMLWAIGKITHLG